MMAKLTNIDKKLLNLVARSSCRMIEGNLLYPCHDEIAKHFEKASEGLFTVSEIKGKKYVGVSDDAEVLIEWLI
jgi:hypothetical protein